MPQHRQRNLPNVFRRHVIPSLEQRPRLPRQNQILRRSGTSAITYILRDIIRYTGIFRGSPLLLQLFWIWFGLPLIGVPINGFAAAVLGLSLNAGAFCAEIFRGGILAVPRGQSEAALASGMTYLQTMRYVVLPQIVRSSLPPLIGQQISLVKDTSLASLISFQELMLMTQSIIDRTHRIFELYIGAAAVYFVICYTLSFMVKRLQRKIAVIR